MSTWIENTIVGSPQGIAPVAIFQGESSILNPSMLTPLGVNPDVWTAIRWPVPPDVNDLDVRGTLVTGSAAPSGKAFIGVTFREPGGTLAAGNYTFYTNRVGDRLPVFARVPAINGLSEMFIHREPGCEWIVNLSVDHYYRNGEFQPDPPAPTPAITAVVQGGSIVATVTGPGNLRDWVGIYAASDTSPQAYLRALPQNGWQYLSGSHVPTMPTTTAVLTFPAPAGAYVLQFWANDGFVLIGASPSVVVP